MAIGRYLIRLDDACPTMDAKKWGRLENVLDANGVIPMVGIIPNCKDEKLMIDAPDEGFWIKVQNWHKKGWAIALHGYDHCYISYAGLKGLNPLWERSEFAGTPLELQKKKIREGLSILNEKGITPKYFFAPSHTFDLNTLTALREESSIRIISDTIATKPYRKGDFIFIPQLGGHCVEMRIPGIWTFCLHPNTMSEENFIQTENFIRTHKEQFITFDSLESSNLRDKDWFSKLMSWAYFKQRKLRGIK